MSLDLMQKLWPHGDQHVAGLVEAISSQAPTVLPQYGIDSNLLISHFMAQCSEECGAGLEMTENMNYSARGLISTWPSRFGSDRAAKFAHNPEMIAEAVYGGRMGNQPPPAHDGWLYRGRGLTQLTGRGNYVSAGSALGLDLITDPDLVNDPVHALTIGAWDFVHCKDVHGKTCLDYARDDDVVGVTRALNGGEIGLPDRRSWLHRWKSALGVN